MAAGFVAGLAVPRMAAAQAHRVERVPVTASMQVRGEATCPDEATLQQRVEAVLSRSVFVAAHEADVRVEADFVSVEEEGWEARLRLLRGGEELGRRTLRTPEASCSALAGPASLVIALMVDAQKPRLVLRVPVPPKRVPALVPRSRPEPTGAGWGMRSGLTWRISYGALPDLAWGLSFDSALQPPGAWPVALSMAVWPARDDVIDGAGGRFRLWHAGLALCPRWGTGRFRWGGCAGAQAGEIEGAGVGLERAREPRHVWVQGDIHADLALRIAGPVGVRLQAGVAVPFHRPSFVYNDAEGAKTQVYRPAPVVPSAGIGLEAALSP